MAASTTTTTTNITATATTDNIAIADKQQQASGQPATGAPCKLPDSDTIKLFVGQINSEWNEDDCRKLLEQFGDIYELKILKDLKTSKSRGCCFVTYYHRSAAIAAQDALHNIKSCEGMRYPLQVKPADFESKAQRNKRQKRFTQINYMTTGLAYNRFLAQQPTIPNCLATRQASIWAQHQHQQQQNQYASPVYSQQRATMDQQSFHSPTNIYYRYPLCTPQQQHSWAAAAADAFNGANPTMVIPPKIGKIGDGRYSNLLINSPNDSLSDSNLLNSSGSLLASSPSILPSQSNSFMSAIGHQSQQQLLHQQQQQQQLHQQQQQHQQQYHSNNYPVSQQHTPVRHQTEGPEGANLFVYHLPAEYKDDDLAIIFASFGEVMSTRVFRDKLSGQSKCFGFVSFSSAQSAAFAIKAMNGHQIGQKRLKVQLKKSKTKHYTGSR